MSMPDMRATYHTINSSEGDTREKRLQTTLGLRDRGGPHEQTLSFPQRLRRTRATEIMHSSLEEPLSHYKALEPGFPHHPSVWRRYHLNHGYRVVDQDTLVIPTNDQLVKTRKGMQRSSSGTVTYSHTHLTKVQLDVTVLGQILNEGIPGGGHTWTPPKLERVFRERTGRPGCWAHYEVPFKQFLALFPKTFLQFGPDQCFIKLQVRGRPLILDGIEDAIVRLARARELGFVEQHPPVEGTTGFHREATVLPELTKHRFKVAYAPHQQMGRTIKTPPPPSTSDAFPSDPRDGR